MKLPKRPTIYQIHTAVWLRRLGNELGRDALRFDEVPASVWDDLGSLDVDAVWFMGVATRSPIGRKLALENPTLLHEMQTALSDLHDDDDVIGSPYCVRDYAVDPRFGGDEALAVAREQLAARGLGLLLDFVPNHIAPDHPWVTEHPERLIAGTEEDLRTQPERFLDTAGGIFAMGSDPYPPAWPDVVQVNAFSPELREAHIATLRRLADQCDGLRCDMAMLMCNDFFPHTWGERAGAVPEVDYWPLMIGAVREQHPDFVFMAEAYWDWEAELHKQGFDYCYDKPFYDHLVAGDPSAARERLQRDLAWQDGLVRFIENHDEPRAAHTLGPHRDRVAAVITTTVPGSKILYHGQFQGYRVHIPVFVNRGPIEPIDTDTEAFYRRLLRAVAGSGLHDAEWSLAEISGWPDNDTCSNLLAWQWSSDAGTYAVVANLSDATSQGRVHLAGDWAGKDWALDDPINDQHFERSGDELAEDGLYVDIAPWQFHFFGFTQK